MNQNKRTSLAVVAIVATMALTAATFTIPQQVFAWGHHYHHHHHHNNNGIKVDQQISQLNVCSGQAQAPDHAELRVVPGVTVCVNNGNNNANIDK